MASNGWRPHRLADACSKIGSGATPRGGKDVYLSSGDIALIRSQNVYNNHFSTNGLAFLTEKHADELSNVIVESGDILLNITGDSVARCTQVPESVLPARVNQHVAIIRPNPEVLDPGFLRYFLVSPQMQERMLGLAAAGATRNALTKGMIEAFAVPAPAITIQRRIADILGSLDDKIELNRRMNETLEAMARRLFKSWFIDFDPVHAKAALRREHPKLSNADISRRALPNMAPEIAKLFPDSFEESTLGPIPKGWKVRTLDAGLSVLETGSRPKGGVKHIESGVPSVGAESIVGIGRFDFGKTKYVPEEFFNAMNRGHIEDRDVLLYKDGGRPGEYEPHVSMFGGGFPFARLCINEHVYRLRTNDLLTQEFLYFWLTSEGAMEEMRVKGTGVAIPGLNSTAVKSLATLMPEQALVMAFSQSIVPTVTAIFTNCDKSKVLSGMRDKLLPRLLSGEISTDAPFPEALP